jgi:hypothetical protein
LLPNLLLNNPDNGIGYSREEDRDTPLLPNNSPLLPSPSNTVTYEKTAHSNDSDGECNPVTLLPNISQTPKKRENLKFEVGDRVRYVGQSHQHQGSFGKVISIEGDSYTCNFMGLTAKGLSLNELEAN